jgi:hypothetical protein
MGINRRSLILALLVVALGVVYTLTSHRRPSLDASGGFVDLVEGTLSTDDLGLILVSRGDDGFKLVNGDAGWVVEDHFAAPANLNKIRTLLGNLEAVTGELRSDDAGVLKTYALDDSLAYHLRIDDQNDQPLVDLLIGKRSGAGCFVREAGAARVYVTDHNFLSDFGLWGDERPVPEVKDWVDLVAFEVPRKDVTRVRVEGGVPLVLDRELFVAETDSAEEPGRLAGSPGENYEWRVNGDFVGSRSRGDAILSTLVSVRARDVLGRGDNPEGSGLDDPSRVVITLEAATDITLLFGGPVEDMDGQVWFRVEGQELIWAVPEFVQTNLFKTADDMRAE